MSFFAATYNIHRCVGRDGTCSPSRIAGVLADLQADIIAIQEFDTTARKGCPDMQPSDLADPLGMHCVARQTKQDQCGGYQANLLLTREPADDIQVVDLGRSGKEVRRAILARVDLQGVSFVAVSAHLGLTTAKRRSQARVLVDAVLDYAGDAPVLMLGDFNEWLPAGGCHAILARHFDGGVRRRTFPSRSPFLPLDRIWTRGRLQIDDLWVHRCEVSAQASDHLPLVARVSSSPRDATSISKPGSDDTSTISP